MCLSNIEVIGQSMAEIQLLPVSKNKGVPNLKVGHVTPLHDAI